MQVAPTAAVGAPCRRGPPRTPSPATWQPSQVGGRFAWTDLACANRSNESEGGSAEGGHAAAPPPRHPFPAATRSQQQQQPQFMSSGKQPGPAPVCAHCKHLHAHNHAHTCTPRKPHMCARTTCAGSYMRLRVDTRRTSPGWVGVTLGLLKRCAPALVARPGARPAPVAPQRSIPIPCTRC